MALDKITTDIIADDAVTAAKIVAGAVEVDIRAGSVTGDKIGYLGDGTGNLSGTIANQQLHFGTAFTLTDNLTVNGDLTLGKVRDDGLGQSLTGSGRTLSGTGTLTMGSSIDGEPKAGRVTSLGSGVTGSPAISLANVTGARTGAHTYAQFQDCNGYGSTSTAIVKFATEDVASNNTVVTVDNNSTYGLYIQANMNCYAFCSFTATGSGAGRNLGFSLNTPLADRTTGINSLTGIYALSSVDTADGTNGMQTSCAVYLASGDVLFPHGDGGAYDTSYTYRQKLTIFAIEAV